MKKGKQAHSSSAKIGMGDFYGTAAKNPMGKVRDMISKPIKKKGKPPKSLA